MKRSIRVPYGNLRVGLLLTFALAIALWASLSGGGTSVFESKKNYISYFKNVNGLLKGSPVWMSGVEVGNVKAIKFVNLDSIRQVEVQFRVASGVKHMMTAGTQVLLGSIGFLGDKYIEVLPGQVGGPVLPEGSEIPVKDAGDATAMFKEGQEAIKDVRSITGGVDSLLGRINRGEGTLGKLAVDSALYVNMTRLLAQLTVLSAELQKNQVRITNSIEKTATSLTTITDKINQNQGSVAKMINDPALYDNLSSTSAQLDTIMRKMNQAKGSAGLLVNDTAMYVQVVNLIERVNNLVTDIQKDPRKYFKFSVF